MDGVTLAVEGSPEIVRVAGGLAGGGGRTTDRRPVVAGGTFRVQPQVGHKVDRLAREVGSAAVYQL